MARTCTVSPVWGDPTIASTAPEKTHGWRRSTERSRPAFSLSCATALTEGVRRSDPPGEAEQPGRREEPQGMDPGRQTHGDVAAVMAKPATEWSPQA